MAVGVARPSNSRCHVGRLAVSSGSMGQLETRCSDDGHPHLCGCHRRVRLVALCALLRVGRRDRNDPRILVDRRTRIRRLTGVFRGRCRCDGVHPRWPLLRSPGETPFGRGSTRAARTWRQRCRRAPQRFRGADSRRSVARRRPVRRPAWRKGCDRRCRRRRCIGDRRVAADGRVRSGRGRAGRRGNRRHRQRRRTADRPSDPSRSRHVTGSNRSIGRRRTDRKSRGATTRRPGVGRLRSGRHRLGLCDPRLLAGRRGDQRLERRILGRGGRTDHCLPVRARTRHTYCPDGWHWTWRSVGDPD